LKTISRNEQAHSVLKAIFKSHANNEMMTQQPFGAYVPWKCGDWKVMMIRVVGWRGCCDVECNCTETSATTRDRFSSKFSTATNLQTVSYSYCNC